MRLPLNPITRLSLASLSLLSLVACEATPAPDAPSFATAADVNLVLPSGGTWAITGLASGPVPPGARLTREGGRVGGSDGCGALSGGFAASGLGLDLPGLTRSGAASGTGCGSGADQVMAALQAASGVNVISDGTLELTANGQRVLTMQRVFRTIRAGRALQADPGPVSAPPAAAAATR